MSVAAEIIFPYQELPVKNLGSATRQHFILRPIIPLTILTKGRLVQFQALLDTGADYNIFHADIADYLGLNLTKGKARKLTGISGDEIKGYEHKLELKIGNHRYKTSATFSRQIPDHALAVLGNNGFFDHFHTTFDYHDQEIILKPHKTIQLPP